MMMDRGVQKEFKICQACERPMVWRKAWERCWDEVKFCSDKCKKTARSKNKPPGEENTTDEI